MVALILGERLAIGAGTDDAASAQPRADGIIAPIAPEVPSDIVAALQEGRIDDAIAGLAPLAEKAKDADDRSYLLFLKGIALRLKGDSKGAGAIFESTLKLKPEGRWSAKIRVELAAIEMKLARPARAEELMREQTAKLLAPERKDRLAKIYEDFADRLLKPVDSLNPADPNGAYELFEQARDLARSPALRSKLLFRMGRASQSAGNAARAVENYQSYLTDHPEGPERFEVRYHLAEAQRQLGQNLQARLTFTDLARNIGDQKNPPRAAENVRALAVFEIASTYGIPNPPDNASLELGLAATRRFLAAYPAHPKAVRATYEIGASYQARGRAQQALDALTRFLKEEDFRLETDEARRDFAELSMTASFQVARILQGQGNFDQALAAWRAYLAKYPNGPQSAEAQHAIIDTALLIASDHLSRDHFLEARKAWNEFVLQNPLDERVPQTLFQIGRSLMAEEKFDQAVSSWDALIARFPQSEPAAHAQFEVAAILENQQGKLDEAVERYRKIATEPWRARALERIAVMDAKALTVITPRTFRGGETRHLKIITRNLEKLTFSAFKLNPEAYFRKKHALENVESLDIGLVAPDAEWTAPVPGYARYKPIDIPYDLPKLEMPGLYVVKVTDEKSLQATTLVIGSDLEAIVKLSRDQVLVFAEDMKTGRGRAGARVLVSDGERIILDATTGPDGLLLHNWEKPRAANTRLRHLLLDAGHVAGSGLGVPDQIVRGLSPRAFIYTDRPAYRPGQTAEIRGLVREVRDGQYANSPDKSYRFEVSDSRGRLIESRSISLSEFGAFHQRVVLDPSSPVGTYAIRVHQPGKGQFSGSLEVQAYQLEPIDLRFEIKKSVYFRGETVQADLLARYQYGAPVKGREIEVSLPDGRTLHGSTDDSGKFPFEFPTTGFAEEQALKLTARLPQDNVAAAATVMLAVRGYGMKLSASRDVYLDGETMPLDLATIDAQGNPTGRTLSVALVKLVDQAGKITEREVIRKSLSTDPKTGKGSISFSLDDPEGGRHIVRASGSDQFGNAIVADRPILVSGKKDETKLRLLTEKTRFKSGESARVNLHSRGKPGTALLTWEADRILSYKLVALEEGDNAVTWTVDGAQFPNFTLSAARMSDHSFDRAALDLQVERELRVTLRPIKPTVGPGEPVELEVEAADQLGKPVAAELSIAVVDQSLLRLYEDRMPPIGPFFYNQKRTGAFATESTNTFRYTPATTPVSQAVVEEAEQATAVAANAVDRDKIRNQAQSQVPMEAPLPAPKLLMEGESIDKDDEEKTLRRGVVALDIAPAPMAPGSGGGMGGRSPHLAARKPERVERLLAAGKRDDGQSQPRQRFVETAYWNPSVVTDANGKAKLSFKAPEALSEYRISARGITGADTLVGEASSSLTVHKSFFVDLKTPGALTQGDKPRFLAQIHHQGLAGKVALKLAVYAGGREEVYPKTVEVAGDGTDEIVFDEFEVAEGESLRLTLSGALGEAKDELALEIPIRPWGVQAVSSASGVRSDSGTAFLSLPKGRTYENPEMRIVLSPTLPRMLIEIALGQFHPLFRSGIDEKIMPPPGRTIADRAAELLGAASVLRSLQNPRGAAAPEAPRLTARIRDLVAGLTSSQNEDGGWPWISPIPRPGNPRPEVVTNSSERMTSAAVVWALASIESLGLLPDRRALDQGMAWIGRELSRLNPSDQETRAALLHALSARKGATFEQANNLNRGRQGLSTSALAHLALTLANLDRIPMADEIVTLLIPRGKTEAAGTGKPSRLYWTGAGRSPTGRGDVEATALVALAMARVRPQAPELARAVDWLLAHRIGDGWNPSTAQGVALAALSAYYGKAEQADDRYRLVVMVNETQVAGLDVTGSTAGKIISVPRKAIQPGQPNRVRFEMTGRGTYGYAVTLGGFTRDFGPDQDPQNRTARIERRVFHPALPELDGKTLAVGFSSVVDPTRFENVATQVRLGGRARVTLSAHRNPPTNQPEWERDFLIIEEHIPAGVTVIEGSVQTVANSYELADGVLTFYFAPDRHPGQISYDVAGFAPGQYRILPASVRSAYEPGRSHLGQAGEFKVLSPGERSTDGYKPTPDELFARGKAHFDAGRHAEANESLELLYAEYSLQDHVLKDTVRMLLLTNIREASPRKIVQYFEVVKEKVPEMILSFDQLMMIGKAYQTINEYERATIVWRGLIEASYLEDVRVGEVLRQRGKTLEGLAYLADLWRSYPNTASIESDLFGLSQVLAQTASRAFSDPGIRRELDAAGVTRSELILQTIRMIQIFTSQSPRNPLAVEASLALIAAFLDLENYSAVVKLADRSAKLYPKSLYLDGFQYSEALGNFHLGRYDRAVDVAEQIARSTYKDANGVEQPSPNKWQAIYILGQIYDARREPAKALSYYRQVADRFSDAAGAIRDFTRKRLELPEVTVIRPTTEPKLKLDYRNITQVDVKAYPVDLMRLYLTRRNLDGIAGIDLAGITPLHEATIPLAAGADFQDHQASIDLPIKKEGAYLVMIRGDDLYSSGIVLVSPLEMDVMEEEPSTTGEAGIRITVRDAQSKELLPKVQIKVVGSAMTQFVSGETDLRGVFVANGVQGVVTAVARKDAGNYAFYRGVNFRQPVPPVPLNMNGTPAQGGQGQQGQGRPQTLDDNLKSQNNANTLRQIQRLQQRYQQQEGSKAKGAAAGEFR
jgi:uncharacterized protein YfaS (alpha-2-macroglobulin family)/tetratricopeptide (TPR) repeat protein